MCYLKIVNTYKKKEKITKDTKSGYPQKSELSRNFGGTLF